MDNLWSSGSVFTGSHMNYINSPVTLTFVNVDLQNLLLPQDLSAPTSFAAILVADSLSLALTAVAHCGHLLHHTWYQLVHADLHACAMAGHAHLCSSFPTPTTCQEQSTVSNPLTKIEAIFVLHLACCINSTDLITFTRQINFVIEQRAFS